MDPRDVTGEYIEDSTTKRQVLQTTTRFYNPFGLLFLVSALWEIIISGHVVQRINLGRNLAI
jgi:hypothetical protein